MQQVDLIDPPIQSMALSDGRQLTYQQFGAPEGRPALYFHGGGGYSLEGGLFHREAVARNLRIIATNRPGTCGSTRHAHRPAGGYTADLVELLDSLGIDKVACFGESNGGMFTLTTAATMPERVVGGVPINPTVPWFDPLARSVSSGGAAIGYRMMKHMPRLLVAAVRNSTERVRRAKAARSKRPDGFDRVDHMGPPPGTEDDVAAIQWRVMAHHEATALLDELKWASSDWGVDYYGIPVPLDLFCGVYDAQAPFALVLADRNPDARFHYAPFGHSGFSHPDARRRIVDLVAGYFDA